MEKINFNKHYLGKCYINFYNKKFSIDDLTNDLKRWLNYKDGRGGIESSEVKMYLICKGGYFFWSGFEPNPEEGYINCDDNVNMFLAIAALRDDTDINQWFVDDNIGIWECSENELSSRYMQMEGHKATVKEIIEHFKDIK